MKMLGRVPDALKNSPMSTTLTQFLPRILGKAHKRKFEHKPGTGVRTDPYVICKHMPHMILFKFETLTI